MVSTPDKRRKVRRALVPLISKELLSTSKWDIKFLCQQEKYRNNPIFLCALVRKRRGEGGLTQGHFSVLTVLAVLPYAQSHGYLPDSSNLALEYDLRMAC
jgi:hypothetical protein